MHRTDEVPGWPDLSVLQRFARLAAVMADAPAAALNLEGAHGAARVEFGMEHPGPAPLRRWATIVLHGPDRERLGSLDVLRSAAHAEPTPNQLAALRDLAAVIVCGVALERRTIGLVQAASRAGRADRMLRLVTDAVSCADALTNVLQELCLHHGAIVGRIWRLDPSDGAMYEVSRFNDDALDAGSYYRRSRTVPITSTNTFTAEAIGSNQPRAVTYSRIADPERYALLSYAVAAGLICQVSYPVWVQEERFGIALAFNTERTDLMEIVADIAALANTIRPALFRKVTEERIRYIAHHDSITQLANRLVFQERMSEAVTAAARGEHGLALLYLDLDGFKHVNDMRGHEVGDKLLASVAARLRENVREGDTVARIGGDEFAVVQPLGGQPDAATKLAKRLLDQIGQPYEIDGQRSMIGVSIGIAIYPASGDNPDQLLRNADTALYRAKEAGRHTFRLFEPAMDVRQQERRLIERDLADAITQHRLALAYQPICDATTLEVLGYEALLRWDHPTRGPMQPDHFVPLAEESGLILPLGQWALEAACTEAATWDQPLRLSVNLSPMQFRQTDLPELVADVLARTGFPAARLNLEVTEGLLLDNTDLVVRTMQALKQQGIGLTLDDFGTAYASMSYLRRFPFDRIKIDKSFVQAMCEDDSTLAIIQAILSLSVRLRLSVVAEGVESDAQLDMLRRLGCHLVQGFHTGSPATGAEVRQRLCQRGPVAHQAVEAASPVGP